nr:PREDICTED: cell cycle checkpoint protein RAD1-like isoform X2 [Bemisia tabaci]
MVVEDSRCIQASAFVCADVFEDYEVKEDPVIFRVNLSTLIECLTIFDGISSTPGASTAVKLKYRQHGAPLQVLLEEEGYITDCSLKTMEAFELLDFDLPPSSVLNKLILRSQSFHEDICDLDPSSEFVEIFMSPDPPYFKIKTVGNWTECNVKINKNSDMVETFQCQDTSRGRYKYTQIKPMLKPLAVSDKVSIRTDCEGLLCFQFMIHTENKQLCYVEYFCTPVIDEPED